MAAAVPTPKVHLPSGEVVWDLGEDREALIEASGPLHLFSGGCDE
jgi:hypothetical protein